LSKANIETKSLEEKLKKTEAEAKAAADKARQGGGKVSPEEIKRAQQEIEQVRDEIEKERTRVSHRDRRHPRGYRRRSVSKQGLVRINRTLEDELADASVLKETNSKRKNKPSVISKK